MINFIPVEFDPFADVKEIEKITFTNEPQREIWLSCMIGGNDANLSYNESVSLQIKGTLNFIAFKTAIDKLILRHEALRATISPNGETLIIYNDAPVMLELQDISGSDEVLVKKSFDTFLRQEMDTVLDLVQGPLFRVFLHKTGEQQYYFTVIKHHIIGDGWSTGIMLEDLSRMYNAYSKGLDITLEPATQLSDYASAQFNFKHSKAYKETEDYWLNLYKDDVPVVDVPTDRPRFAPRSYKGNRIDNPVSKEMADQLKAVGAKQGCSLVTTLLAAFEVFLYQLTQQENLVVGLPASGQAATGLTNVVGHCVNLLPLKTHVDASLPFSGYLKRRKGEVLDAYDHQRITFGELIKKLYIPRDPSRIPLVPVMFNIDMGMDNAVAFDGLSFKLISNPRNYENFEIYLNATGSKNGIIFEWSYNTDLFDATTINAFNNSYYAILQQIITNPAINIAALSGVQKIVNLAPENELYIAPEQNIISLMERIVGQYSNKTAVSFNQSALTYRELNEKTDQFAALLAQNGIKSADIVAISLDRSLEMLVCLLGVLKAGAAYLPLDPEYPADRIRYMLEDSTASLIITSKEHKNKYSSLAKELVVDEVWYKLKDYKKEAFQNKINGNDLAYLLYTSGSTGKPKGVKITHRNLTNFLLSMQIAPGIKVNDALLAVTSISFDIAGLELYLPLITGAEVVIASTEATHDGRMLLNILEEKNISMMQATPSTWQMLLDSGWEKRYPIKMLSGGEALPKELADKLLKHGAELWNMYGPTETTIWSTIKHINPQDKLLTIGYPIHNTVVYIMDELGKPQPSGKTGEIYIGGEGVANGYWNRPELTAEKFVTNNFNSVKGGKLYRTGDLGKVLPNGEIQCLGRIDDQVKIRGHRIELGEIETLTAQQEGIKQAVVIAREDTPNDKRLIAYVTLKDTDGNSNTPSWKDRWDTLYETGAEAKQNKAADKANIDGTLLENLENSVELIQQKEEWLKTSVERIKELNAKRIYEIGSGAGQILFELAPNADYYMATDYAQAAITNIQERLTAEPAKWKHVKASVAPADDFSAIGNSPIDLILINSVAQYFPNTEYLITVIKQAVNVLKHGGCLFIGDMQGMGCLEMYHAADYLPRASDSTTVAEFKKVVENRVRIEEELVADPTFFYLLPKLIPQITGVDIQLRKGKSINETTKYHYDIWLYVGKQVEVAIINTTIQWKPTTSIQEIEAALLKHNGQVIEFKGILNSRTGNDYWLLHLLQNAVDGESVKNIKKQIERDAPVGIHPDELWEMGNKMGWNTHLRWNNDGTNGTFDVVFIPKSDKLVVPGHSIIDVLKLNIYDFARTPIISNEVQVPYEVIQSWKKQLYEVLPAYMVPEEIVVLKKFPLTPNAKIDKKALPKPQPKNDKDKTNQRKLTINEQIITDIWCDILGIQNLHPTDDFFQLGGHSLLAVKVMVAIEKKTGKRLPIATLFNNATIEKLAAQLAEEATLEKWDSLVPIRTSGNKVPLFLIHGGGMNILLFKSLIDYFEEDQPVYGVQALGFNHKTDVPQTIEGIAARYVAEIVRVHPDGPYSLAGYSLGGFLAFEMARQLKTIGKSVKFLAIMDTYAGNNIQIGSSVEKVAKKIARQFSKVPFYAGALIKNPKESIEYHMLATKKRLQKLQTNGTIIPEDTFNEYESGIYRQYSDALDAFILTPLDVKLILFRVQKRLYFLDDLTYLGWDKFAKKGVQVYEIPGDHKTFLFPPNSKQFAHIMQKALEKEYS